MNANSLIASLVAGAVVTTAVATAVNVSPMMIVDDFSLYKPPNHIELTRADYLTSPSGGYSSGNEPTAYPTFYLSFPYVGVFFGAFEDYTGQQGYFTEMYLVFSKEPFCDLFTFSYNDPRATYGSIRATAKTRDKLGSDNEVYVVRHGWSGVQEGANNVYVRNFSTHVVYGTGKYYFDFDFFYVDDSSIMFEGLPSVSGVPYKYLLRCIETGTGHSGGGGSYYESSGGGTSGGSSSSGGGSSSGSSGGGIPGVGPGGNNNWWESSGGGSNPDLYPWEKPGSDSTSGWEPSVPKYPGGTEDDNGENGDTWEIPGYDIPAPPFSDSDINIPSMPEMNFPEVPTPEFNFPDFPGMPDVTPPVLDYQPDMGSGEWPPPFPGFG